MRFTIMSYGGAILIISAIMHYLVVPGLENCSSMTGIVSTYMSKDYSLGCRILSDIQIGVVAGEIAGAAIIAVGLLLKPRIV
ncbi:MAG: hypothetical protein KGI33_03105 [Thaumarchaeota archaeon]|nr:hypothetical protein [Nitrososphaerota archaeon]